MSLLRLVFFLLREGKRGVFVSAAGVVLPLCPGCGFARDGTGLVSCERWLIGRVVPFRGAEDPR